MHLPNNFTIVTRLSKILALILFVLFPFVGFFLGIKYQNSITKKFLTGNEIARAPGEIVNTLPNGTPVSNPEVCKEPHLLDLNSQYKNIKLWDSFVKADSKAIYYIEANHIDNIVCKYELFRRDNLNIEYLRFDKNTLDNKNQISFILHNDETNTLEIIDLLTHNRSSIPLEFGPQYNVYYGNSGQFDEIKYLGGIIVVVPITFVGGCASGGDCTGFNNMVKNDWNRTDVSITIVRTDGKYLKVPRNKFPQHTDFEDVAIIGKTLSFSVPSQTNEPLINLEELN